jgi:DHA1 family multidrug resistance protein-like MFS transporter
MLDTIREAPLGQAIRLISRNRLLKYPEEKDDFVLPAQYRLLLRSDGDLKHRQHESPSVDPELLEKEDGDNPHRPEAAEDEDTDLEALEQTRTITSVRTAPYSAERMRAEQALDRTNSLVIIPQKTSDGIILVDWYTTDDPANPQSWSSLKKNFIVFILCLYTCTVYCAGPIYAASAGGVVEKFKISPVAASLGLSLYVLAYGIGDLLFSPLTEIPAIGRNPVYCKQFQLFKSQSRSNALADLTFIVFWILSFPTAVVNSYGGFLALRFFLGFFGSPALANGGATVGDMYHLIYIPYGLSWWVLSAWCGPAFGPLIGGFAAMAKGWRWPMWEVVWMASPVLLALLTLMPETSGANILLRRARRLRKLTGDNRLQSQSEIDQQNMSAKEILFSALIRPMEIMLKDPSIFFVNLYTGYFYGGESRD